MQEFNPYNPQVPFSPPPRWLKPTQREKVLRVPTRLFWAIVWSVLWHVLILWGLVFDMADPPPPSSPPLSVVLDVGLPIPDATAVTPEEARLPEPPPPEPKVKPEKTVAEKTPQEKMPKVMTRKATAEPSTFSVPEPTEKPTLPPPNPVPTKPAVDDFSTMLKRRQAQRLAEEMAAKRANDAASEAEKEPSEDEKRNKNIMANLKFGTNGLFQIRRMDPYNASFSFKGWTGDYSSANTQFYEVEAKTGQDIRLSVVRRMIAIIREHYDGDFVWESHRLNRPVNLSARPADSGELEDFLMKEFFGPNYKFQDPLRY